MLGKLLITVASATLLAGCAMNGQGPAKAERFRGEWVVFSADGTTPPANFVSSFEPQGERLVVRSAWQDPRDGRIGLTLVGVATPELILDASGAEAVAQIGPFVFRHRSEWRGDALETRWSTSDYMGSSYRGTWKRSVSPDGAMMTLDIEARANVGGTNHGQLMFRRK